MTSRAEAAGSAFVFDAARAVAAVAVMLAHARSLVLLDASDQPPLSAGWSIFFALTGLGHQAVIVFFVVSGMLITRSLLAMHRAGRWSPGRFATARLVRLWIVLLPCLVLGGLQDRIGLTIAGTSAGVYGASDTSAALVGERLGPGVFAGNAALLQGLVLPAFGSNVPLWTLSVEAWCYVLAFCLFALWRTRHAPLRASIYGFVIGSAAAFVLTPAFWSLASLWAIGAVTAFASPQTSGGAERRTAAAGQQRLRRLIAAVMWLAILGVARAGAARNQAAGDYALAIATACAFLAWFDWMPRSARTVRATRRVADLSYSLFLSHFPLLALVAGLALHGRRLPIGSAGLLLTASAALLALAQAALLWSAFERHTKAVRDIVLTWTERRAVPDSGRERLAP